MKKQKFVVDFVRIVGFTGDNMIRSSYFIEAISLGMAVGTVSDGFYLPPDTTEPAEWIAPGAILGVRRFQRQI